MYSTVLLPFATATPSWGMPVDISVHGWRTDQLINHALVIITVLFLIKVIWMLWACMRHGPSHTAHYDHGDSRGWTNAKLAIGGFIFFGVDGYLFANSTLDLSNHYWNYAELEQDPRTLKVEINAHQWAWDVRQAGPDAEFDTSDDIVTLNELYVPVDTPILMQLGAAEVVHSLYIPNVRVKQDIVPGNITMARFEATETGTFEFGCAQHCGAFHYKMRGRLNVLSQAEYRAWAAQASMKSALAFNPADLDSRWGWTWKEQK
jgi:cytochrome c oxidase subunit 2